MSRSDPKTRDIHASMDALMDAHMPRPPGKEDWVYRDMYSWVREDYWEQFLATFGEGEYMMIAGSQREMDGNKWYRGQFFISPKGMENLRLHIAAREAEKATKQ